MPRSALGELVALERDVGFGQRHRVEVGLRVGKRDRRLDRAVSRREHQRCPAAARKRRVGPAAARELEHRGLEDGRSRVHLGAGGHEGLHHRGVILRRRPHERGLAEPLLPGLDVGAAAQERLHGLGAAGARRGHEHRLPCRRTRVGIGASFDQGAQHLGAAVGRGQRDRLDAVAVGGFDVGAGPDEHRHQVERVGPNGVVQRGGAVGLGLVDVGLGAQQRPHGVAVAALDGLDDRRRRAGRRQAGHRQQYQDPDASQPEHGCRPPRSQRRRC